jgi:2-amino-4-hydroxy-6-hydroxymethyldihydropteridine diphosphokinase
MTAHTAFLALGANIGNREANLRHALRLLADACDIVAVSSLYRSDAVVLEGQPPGPDYLNAVCEVRTSLDAHALLRLAKRIEHDIGRRPTGRWAPRPIDIDLLLSGDDVIESAELIIPHPRIAERAFVLAPLAEIAPNVEHPVARRTIAELARGVPSGGLERVAGPEWATVPGAAL